MLDSNGKSVSPTNIAKYLDHLLWNKQLAPVQVKIKRVIEILSILRYNNNVIILKVAYHLLFGSYLQDDVKL